MCTHVSMRTSTGICMGWKKESALLEQGLWWLWAILLEFGEASPGSLEEQHMLLSIESSLLTLFLLLNHVRLMHILQS